jgi:hypothetical protein
MAVTLCLCASFPALAETPESARSAAADDAVVVQADGFSTMGPGVTVEEAHAAALADARRNALSQAMVDLEAELAVVDRRVAESVVRVHALGRIRETSVSSAGVLPDSDPPVYRVRIRALISSRGRAPGFGGLPEAGWMPRVALAVTTEEDEDAGSARLNALKQGLTACGVQIVPMASALPHLAVEVTVAGQDVDGAGWTQITWQVADPADPSLEAGVAPVSGAWQIAGQAAPGSSEWRCLAVRLAQDSLKAWLTPREASFVVEGVTKDEGEALVQVLRRSPATRIERSLDDSTVEADLSVAGCPVAFFGALLDQAGIAERCRVGESSLTAVSYGPPAREAAADEPGSESTAG